MTQTELLADLAARNLDMLKMTLADFSEADMLVRPCSGANHAAWQLGHLINSESFIANAIKPGANPTPEKFNDKFNKDDACNDTPAYFPSKAELLETLGATRNGTVQLIRSLTPSDLDKPGPEALKKMAPTVGHLVAMVPMHLLMHLGQLQVIRRKLGKPLLF
jgi:hypothetical protein